MRKPKNFELEFIKKVKESEDAFSFYYARPRGLDFKPGQYIKLFLDIKNPDSRGSSRYFTISSNPTEKEFLVITTKIIKSSFKKKLFNLTPEEKVNAFGPIGYFDFDPEKDKNIVFLSGGIGITLYHSFIQYIDSKKLSTNVVLIASFDLFKNIIFKSEFEKIKARNNKIKIIYTLTKERNLIPGFEKGRISEKLIGRYVPNLKKQKLYIVGSAKTVEGFYKVLKRLNVPDKNIFKEDFPGY